MTFDDLHDINPHLFEIFVGQVFLFLDYTVLVTAQTADGGIDVVADKHDPHLRRWIRHVIQVKRYRSNIGIEKVRELNGVLHVHNASFGAIITLSGFKRGVRETTSVNFPSITLIAGNQFKDMLATAGFMDAEGKLVDVTDPNLDRNRRYASVNVLRSAKPKPLSEEELIKQIHSRYFVTVAEEILRSDCEYLQNSGNAIFLQNSFYYKPTTSEIEIALRELPRILQGCDYFFQRSDIFRLLEEYFGVNAQIWEHYFDRKVDEVLGQLVVKGDLQALESGLYAPLKALQRFQSEHIDRQTIYSNLEKVLGIGEDDSTCLLKNSKFYPKKGEAREIAGMDKAGKKILPFLEVSFSRCPNCDALHVWISEKIQFYTTTQAIDDKLQSLPEDAPYTDVFALIARRLEVSREFVLRLGSLLDRYFGVPDGASINIYPDGFMCLSLFVDVDENGTLAQLRDEVVDICDRFQSFIWEVFSSLPRLGRPRYISSFGEPAASKGVEEASYPEIFRTSYKSKKDRG